MTSLKPQFTLKLVGASDVGVIMLESEPVQTRVLVRDSPSGKLRPFVESVDIKTSSHGAPWGDALVVEHNLMPASEMASGYIDRTTIIQPLVNYDVPATRLGREGQAARNSLKGVIHIDPSGSLTGASWSEPINILFLMPSEMMFERVYKELANPPSQLELTRTSFAQDVQMQQIGLAILTECQTGFLSGRLYGEALAMALTARLVNSYSSHPLNLPGDKGLPSWRLRRVIDFIEENIGTELGLSDLAAVAGFSEYHFSRVFKLTTGVTPYRYVIERRVARAKEMLSRTQMPIMDISTHLGFGDQAHLTTVFRKYTGVTPKKFRDSTR